MNDKAEKAKNLLTRKKKYRFFGFYPNLSHQPSPQVGARFGILPRSPCHRSFGEQSDQSFAQFIHDQNTERQP